MIVISVARKPVTESNVAANVLRWSAGALSIDASRLKVVGEDIHMSQSNPEKRSGAVGTNLGFTDNAINRFQEAQRESIERTKTLGRWPTNLFLSHQPGCDIIGMRDIKAGPAIRTDMISFGKAYNRNVYTTTASQARGEWAPHGNGDGTETIPVWKCAPECPVDDLNVQSGESQSKAVTTRGGNRGLSFKMKKQDAVPCYADKGGASRYFKTFR